LANAITELLSPPPVAKSRKCARGGVITAERIYLWLKIYHKQSINFHYADRAMAIACSSEGQPVGSQLHGLGCDPNN